MGPLAAGLLGGGSLLGGLFSGLASSSGAKHAAQAQLQATRETNQQNYKIWQEQRQHAIDMWNMENDYNSPINQRQRLVDAGYNPYLAFGDVGNTAGSVNVPSAPTMVAPSAEAFPNTAGILAENINNGFQNAINNYINFASASAEIDKKNSERRGQDLNNEYFEKVFDWRANSEKYNSWTAYQNSDFAKWNAQSAKAKAQVDSNTIQIQIDQQKEVLRQTRIQNASLLLDVESKSIMNKYLDANQQQQLWNLAALGQNLVKEGLIKDEQLKTQIASTALVWANVANVNADTEGKNLENKFNQETYDTRVSDLKIQNQRNQLDFKKANALANNMVRSLNLQYEAQAAQAEWNKFYYKGKNANWFNRNIHSTFQSASEYMGLFNALK